MYDGWRKALSTEETLLTPPGLPEADPLLDENVATLLSIGMDFAKGIVDDEPKVMRQAWIEARQHVARLAEEADARLTAKRLAQALDVQRGKARAQVVYFIASAAGPIKIGIAGDPVARLKALQTSHPEPLAILATCAGGAAKERAYHDLFASHRMSGEWFARVPAIEAEIAKLQPSSPHAPSS